MWEDALGGGLVRVEPVPGAAMADGLVVLTPRGRAVLADAGIAADA